MEGFGIGPQVLRHARHLGLASDGTTAESAEHVVGRHIREAPRLGVALPAGRRHQRGAAQHALAAAGRQAVQAARGRGVARPGAGAAGHPLEDVAPDEAAAGARSGPPVPIRVRSAGGGRPSGTRPRPRGATGASPAGRPGARCSSPPRCTSTPPRSCSTSRGARRRWACSQAQPASVHQLGAVVAAVLGELDVALPAHGLGVDLEFGHRHGVGPAFVVGHEAAPLAAQLQPCGGHPQRLAVHPRRRPQQRRGRVGLAAQLQRRGALGQRLAEPVFVQQGGTVDMQLIVARRRPRPAGPA
jgi:hypothetical protein